MTRNYWRKGLAIGVACLAFVLGAGTVSANVPSAVYMDVIQKAGLKDVNSDFYATPAIAKAIQAGIMQGDPGGTFRPNDPVKAGETVAIFMRVLGLAGTHDSLQSTADQAVSAGLASPEMVADLARPASRLEVARLLGKMLNLKPKLIHSFADAPFADAIAAPLQDWGLLAALREAGVFVGFPDGTFRPQEELTRAQIAVLIDRVTSQAAGHRP